MSQRCSIYLALALLVARRSDGACIDTAAYMHWAGGVTTPGISYNLQIDGHFAYLCSGTAGIHVFDVASPGQPALVTHVDTPGTAYGIAVRGTSWFLADGQSGLQIIDATQIGTPQFVGQWDTPGVAEYVEVVGSVAYVVDSPGAIHAIDIGDPAHPAEIWTIPGEFNSLGFQGPNLVAVGDGVHVYDISSGAPVEIGGFSWGTVSAANVVLHDSRAYVSCGWGAPVSPGLIIVDLTDPAHPQSLGGLVTEDRPYVASISGSDLFLPLGGLGVAVVDVTVPAAPLVRGRVPVSGTPYAATLVGSQVLVAAGRGGLQVIDASVPVSPAPTAWIAAGGSQGFALSGEVAVTSNLQFVDLHDPAAPVIVASAGHADETVAGVAWSGNLVVAGIAFSFAVPRPALRVFDASDASHPVEVSTLALTGEPPVRIVTYGSVVYMALADAIRVVDIEDPYHPVEGMTLPLASVSALLIQGARLYVAASGGIHVIDISTAQQPVVTGFVPVSGSVLSLAVEGSLLVAGGSGIRLFSLADPDLPVQIGAGAGLRAYSVAIAGTSVYAGQTSDIAVFDIADPQHPVRLGSMPTSAMVPGLALVGGWLYAETAADLEVFAPQCGVPTAASPLPAGGVPGLRVTNPARRAAILQADLVTETGRADLSIFDVAGRLRRTFILDPRTRHSRTQWDGRDDHSRRLPAGVYFVRLATDRGSVQRPVTLLR